MECPVCLGAFDQQACRPLCLPCGHTVCAKCVLALAAASNPFLCPTCRRDIPSQEAESLPTNFSLFDRSRPQTAAPKDKEGSAKCGLHTDKKAKFCCSGCNQEFCSKCVVRHTGAGHQIEDISLVVDRKLDLLLLDAAKIGSQLFSPDFFANLDKQAEALVELRGKVESAYEDAIAGVIKEKEDTLATLKEAIEQNRAQIDSAKESAKDQSAAFSEARELLRASRHSVASMSEKRTNIEKAEGLLSSFKGKLVEKAPPQCELRLFAVKRMGFTEKWVELEETVVREERKEEEKKEEVKIEKVMEAKKDASIPRMQAQSTIEREAGKKRREPGWWFMADTNSWSPYALHMTRQIEAAFQRKEPSIILGKYIIDFTTMMQTNKFTHKQRKVGREIAQ